MALLFVIAAFTNIFSAPVSAAVHAPLENCTFTAHPNTTFLGNISSNVIACFDHEGLEHCQRRCAEDEACAGFGLCVRGSRLGRCCTKFDNLGSGEWVDGVSYTKNVDLPGFPADTPVSVNVSIIFRGNSSFPYNKGAMIQALPGGLLAASCQAGDHEAAGNQRILYALSTDNGKSWPDGWSQVTPEPFAAGQIMSHSPQEELSFAQWEPTLFLAPDNETLWLFWSEGPGNTPNLLLAQTTNRTSGFTEWGPRKVPPSICMRILCVHYIYIISIL